jgi:thiol-disulfide isomerase/thioredoxin
MRNVALIFLAASAALTACGSDTTVAAPGPEQDKGVTGDGQGSTVTGTEKNPYGVDYPSDGIGTSVGSRMQNFKFLGYKEGNTGGGLVPVSLADYFDPETKQYKLIHVQAAGVWCNPCQEEMEMVTPLADQLKAKKVVWITAVVEGRTPGAASTRDDLDLWVRSFKAPYTQVLDPGNANLGVFYDRAAIPWNCDIDARSMRILYSGTGAPPNQAALLKDLDDRIKQIDSTPAK